MRLEIETGELTIGDAEGLVSFMFCMYPSLREKLLGTTGNGVRITSEPLVIHVDKTAAVAALADEIPEDPDALEAFAEGGPGEVIPEAAEAFQGPLSASADTAQLGTGAGGPLADASTGSQTNTGTNAMTGASLSNVVLDVDGVPWDAEIHSGGKKKNSDGRWAKKRGVSDDRIKAKTAELKAIMGNGASPGPANPPSAPSPGPAPAPSAAPAPPAAPKPELTPEAIAQAQAAALAGAGQFDQGQSPAVQFATFMREFGQLRATGKITPEVQSAILEGLGLKELANLLQRPDMIGSALAQFQAIAAA